MKIPRQEYTAEFTGLAVKRIKAGQSSWAVARELSQVEQTLRNRLKAGDAGKLNGVGAKAATPKQMELLRQRAENIWLQRQCEISKKATAYFAKDAL